MEKEIFRDFLSRKGLKLTKERQKILDEVFTLHGHFDPEGLLERLRRREAKVSKASVYRTLPLLVQCGLVEQVERDGKHARYEHTFGHGHHDHLICVKCGRVIEVFSPKLEAIQDDLCRESKFNGITHTLEIKGYCQSCERCCLSSPQ
ncbi:MAG: transcriptional repressor [Nitrospirae bacterium]|nr:transcriptional repressor [Nitrospirota bacterium]